MSYLDPERNIPKDYVSVASFFVNFFKRFVCKHDWEKHVYQAPSGVMATKECLVCKKYKFLGAVYWGDKK